MKASKAYVEAENKRLSHALGLHEQFVSHAFRSEVTYIKKGNVKLGICGETRAHGGIVLEAMKMDGSESRWSVIGVFYWENYQEQVRNYPARADDKEAQDRRACVGQIAQRIAKIQGEFYSKKTLEAVTS